MKFVFSIKLNRYRHLRRHFFFCALCFISVFLFAQSPYLLHQYDTKDGLSNDWVSDIFQDSRGFIWIATQYGIDRFDGHSFKTYRYNPDVVNTLSVNWIRTIAEDKDGNLWFGTHGGGLNVFDPRTESFQKHLLPYGEGNTAPIVFKVFCDNQNNIWVATPAGLFCGKFNSQFRRYLEVAVYDLKEAGDGIIWLATARGLYYGNTPAGLHRFEQNKHETTTALCIADPADNIWYFGDKGLSVMTLKGWEKTRPFNIQQEKHPGNHFFSPLFQDGHQKLWIGVNLAAKLVLLENGKIKHIQDQQYRRAGSVTCIMEDSAGNIWVGTTEGIYVFGTNVSRFRNGRYDSTLTGLVNVREVLQDGGDLWYSIPGGLYRKRTGDTSSRLVLKKSVIALLKGKDGNIYAGVSDSKNPGIYCIDPHTLRSSFIGKAKGFRGDVIWALTEDKRGRIWVGAKGSLQCYDPAGKNFIALGNNQNLLCEDVFVLDLLLDDEDDLWIATLNCGLYLLPKPHAIQTGQTPFYTVFTYNSNDTTSLSSNLVQCLHKTSTGDIWVGTDGGLNRLLNKQGQKFRRYLQKDDLADDKILALNSDLSGRIWAATIGHGLVSLNPNEQNSIVNYTTKDGLFSNAFLLSSTYRASDGTMFFGTDAGLQIFNPTEILPNKGMQPPLHFSDVSINGQILRTDEKSDITSGHITFSNSIQLNPAHKTIAIQYAALDFTNPSKTKYYYVLSRRSYWTGNYVVQDVQSNQSKQEVTFTNLFPGTYSLTIKAVNKEQNWEAQSRPLSIYVSPPLYLSQWAILLYILLVFGIFYSVYRFRINQKLMRAEALRQQELIAFKTRLYTNITHEFRTPLTVILGEASQLEKQVGQKQQGSLAAIRRQGQGLLNLVNQMLDLAKAEAGSLRQNMVQGNIVLFLKYLLESFRSLANNKQIELDFHADSNDFWMDFDPDKLRTIVSNLLSNAIKFTPSEGRIILQATTRHGFVFRVSDTGPGIPQEKLPFVFDRFYQADDSSVLRAEGSGIGLTLTKELVHLLGGEINAESRLGVGSTFTVTLPVTRTAAKQQFQPEDLNTENREIGLKPEDAFFFSHLSANEKPQLYAARPRLLLIEDNLDVVQYLLSLLSADYQIYEARNGKEGAEAAFRLVPDLIVSDVMMPEMDGFEVCQTLKTDLRTSHIPVILLTARADLDSRLEGLEHGADAYLAKPFEERELKVQLRKLHELRQSLRERYTQPDLPIPSTLPAFRREDAFFQDLLSVLEDNFSNPAFGVPELCKAMHLSRPNLYRKLTALTGKNIEGYLRSFRLHRAHKLLRTTDLPVQTVAWDCGFSDPAHFTRAFQAEFGMTPSQAR